MIKKICLEPIVTEGKPGSLVNLRIDDICLENNINFKANHTFYLNDLNSNKSRGNHSNSNAKEMLICLQGSFDVYLLDNKTEYNFHIKKNEIIYIPNNVWIEIKNFENCIIIAYVDIFQEKQSIYSLEEYKKFNN